MLLMLLFALVITLLVFVLSSRAIYDFQRRVTMQSVEFNLQLVAGIIAQDMRDLENFARWCGTNETIASFFVSGRDDGLEGWRRLSEEFYNNRAASFVNRLLIFDYASRRVLQMGNLINASVPVTRWNVDEAHGRGISPEPGWQGIAPDPFYTTRDVPVIPLVNPLYNPNNGAITGTVLLAASTTLITGKFSGYQAPSDTDLYLAIGGQYYRIQGDNLIPEESSWTELSRAGKDAIGAGTMAITLRFGDGRRRTLVGCRIREGITLAQTLRQLRPFPAEGAWPALAAGIALLLLLLALLWSGINRQTGELAALMEERIAREKKAQDLEYRMLLSQINPHFLYNTLNSIKWMASIQKASGIAEMITALSRLLRTVTKDTRKTASLREEIALLEDYLVIQKYRYGDSVIFKKEIEDEALLNTPIPRFTLQPLAENAIFHGLEPKGGGVITVRVRKDPENPQAVLVSLEDNGVGMNAGILAGIHGGTHRAGGEEGEVFRELGIHNVEERLRYAGSGGLSIESEEGAYTVMTISLNLEAAGD
jgi:two-component system sensor histidine kinase YesM